MRKGVGLALLAIGGLGAIACSNASTTADAMHRIANKQAQAAGAGRGEAGGTGGDTTSVSSAGRSGSAGAAGADANAGSAAKLGGSAGATVAKAAIAHPSQPSCNGWTLTPSFVACVADSECTGGQRCIFNKAPTPPCTLGCVGPMDQCGGVSGQACPTGQFCQPDANRGSCSCGGGNRCVPNCTSDAVCAADSRCDSSGPCVPRGCNADFECPSGQTCDLTAPDRDAHGCRPMHCDETGGTCGANKVCMPNDPRALSGCAAKHCKTGSDCDCGACSAELSDGTRECIPSVGYCGLY